MACSCSSACCSVAVHFTQEHALRELSAYTKKGPGPTTKAKKEGTAR